MFPVRPRQHRRRVDPERERLPHVISIAQRRDMLAVKAMISELEAEAEAITDQIKAAMVERGEEVIACPNWSASWKNTSRI